MIVDKLRSYDGWDSLAAGMDAGRRPSLIEQNQCAVARDVIFRGGVPESRPGYRQMTLEFEEEIYYKPDGAHLIGPVTVHDASMLGTGLTSQTAKFTALDIGTVVQGSTIPPGTTITDLFSEGFIGLSATVSLTFLTNQTVTFVGRTFPTTFIGNTTSGSNLITSATANFNAADVGKEVTSYIFPVGTRVFITRLISPILVQTNTTFGTHTGDSYTMPDRVHSRSSTETFANEAFQCACYYAPDASKECIMATLGGRLFQITPLARSAKVREIPLGINTDASFTDGVENSTTTLTSATAKFTQSDVGKFIVGENIAPGGVGIASVTNTTTVIMNVPATATATGVAFTILDRSASLGRNRSTIPINYMVQADRYFIVQDGESPPIIFDGVAARRAAADEVIVGTIMAYGIGRLVVTRGRNIYFGDLFGSHSGDPSDSILKFTETNFLSEGFPASIPYSNGEITAAIFYPTQDTATGQGELIIFTDHGAVSFDLHLPREQWKTSTFQQIALINSTARGDRALTIVNGDIWIRSDEGWRAYRQARAQATGWYQLPQSTEVTPWIAADTPQFLRFGSAIHFDNRLLVTSNPVPNGGRVYHSGLLSLDFSVLSSFGQASRPAWDGHWGKLRVLQLITGTFKNSHRAFAFGLDDNDETQLFEITTQDLEDFDGPITSEIEFRSHNFNSPFNEKQLYGADIWVDKVSQPVSMELTFRPDSSNDYLFWKRFDQIRPAGGPCGEITCGAVPTLVKGFAPRQRVGKPLDDCEDHTGRLIRRGFEFQPKLNWTGHASIRRMRLHAMQEEEDPKGLC